MDKLRMIAENFALRGITCYYVGGTVRNEIMGIPSDDIDICLVGVKDKSIVPHIVSRFGTITEEVGRNFPNWTANIDGEKVDFALARTEKKIGDLHQDFSCDIEGVTIFDDLMRRDLTINALAKNMLTGDIVDPFNGKLHIYEGIAHPVSEAFAEDALRVVRAARFCAYFDLYASPVLLNVCRSLSPVNISRERIGQELMKTLKYAKTPSMFFDFLREVGWLEYWFPELYACIGVPQNPKHHPEGDVYTHTMHTINAAKDWFTRAVMLCHDLGKAVTTKINGIDWNKDLPNEVQMRSEFPDTNFDWKVSSNGHEEAGVPLAKAMLSRVIFGNKEIRQKIATLVKLHMIRAVIDDKNYVKMVRRTVRELMGSGLQYEDLVKVIHADLSGRPPLAEPLIQKVRGELFAAYADEVVREGTMIPIINGRKLAELGMQPGKMMGDIMKKSLELQDRGTLNKDNWQERMKQCGFEFFK